MSSSDLKLANGTTGIGDDDYFQVPTLRNKRNVAGPAGSNAQTRYVELLLVVDTFQYIKLKKDKDKAFVRYRELANVINSLYEPVNIYVVLLGIIIWDKANKIAVSSDGGKTLDAFLKYRYDNLLEKHPNDNAQLITGVKFSNSVVGKAVKNSICTSKYSGGVNMDHGSVGLVAATVAHEMGHNFGLSHDGANCECDDRRCIMTSVTSYSTAPTKWSSCSEKFFKSSVELGFCLHNKPKALLGPDCGNGFVEKGEQCDCGLKKECKCCEPNTCKLLPDAKCATGACCDLNKCRVKHVAHVCRPAITECDLPEYCNGQSEFCPNDFYIQDGEQCHDGQAYCARGKCRTHIDQCYFLWGHDDTSSPEECFRTNLRGDAFGNCGYFHINDSYAKCERSDVKCGMLQCSNSKGKLKLGGKVTKHSATVKIRNPDGISTTCRSIVADYGPSTPDPGLVPDGAMCDKGRMCLNQKCVDVDEIKIECPNNCSNAGICNNAGNCHCFEGYEAPFCDVPGPGGSIDSGPASDPTDDILLVVYVVTGSVLPLLVIIAIVCLCRKRIQSSKIFKVIAFKRKEKPSQAISKTPPKPRQPIPFHILPTHSVRDAKTQEKQISLVNAIDRKSVKARPMKKSRPAPPPPPKRNQVQVTSRGTNEIVIEDICKLSKNEDQRNIKKVPLKPPKKPHSGGLGAKIKMFETLDSSAKNSSVV